MRKYILLFLPLVMFGFTVLAFFIFREYIFAKIRDRWVSVGLIIGAWGCIQTLFYYKRPYKSRFRLLLSACILIGTVTPIYLILGNVNEAWPIIPVAISANLALILYLLRHRKPVFSLAPRWAQLKQLGITGSLIGWAGYGIFLVGNVMYNGMFLRMLLPMSNPFEYLPIPWAIISVIGIVSYYVEEILHQKRNTGAEWQKRIDTLGKHANRPDT